jgi:hypothetical protein
MLNRRFFLGGLSASLPIIALPASLRAQAARPRLHAMIVGINEYSGRIRGLKGCVNDARDIERQVRPLDANARVLINNQATRASFFSAWQDMMSKAREGDTLLLAFSGHGGQEPERIPGNEADGLDETLILSGFDFAQSTANADRIIDDELADLFAAAGARRLTVVFIADSCHSGTVHRGVELADVSYRTINRYELTRSGPAGTPQQASAPEAQPNLVFLAGSQENEKVPEITVDGTWHGALSVAVARALQGAADTNKDGLITADELARFVLRHARALSDSGQHPTKPNPEAVFGMSPHTPIIALGATSPVSAEIGPVRLRILGLTPAEQQRIGSTLKDAKLVGDGEAASLIWDSARRLVLNDQGHRIAEGVEASGLQNAIERRRALERIIKLSAGHGVDLRIRLPGEAADAPPSVGSDATHKPGDIFDLRIGGIRDGYFTAFNLTGNGQVELLEPYPRGGKFFEGPAFKTGVQTIKGVPVIELKRVQVKPEGPFGAEHVIAVAGEFPLRRLMPALQEAHNKFAVTPVMAALAMEAEMQPLQVGFQGIYTAKE